MKITFPVGLTVLSRPISIGDGCVIVGTTAIATEDDILDIEPIKFSDEH